MVVGADKLETGRVIIFSGPSGVGKGTILKRLFSETSFPLTMSVSATTRSPRPGERNGVDYWFLTPDEFARRYDRGDFLESFEVFAGGARYGTLRETVERSIEEGRWVVMEIDVKGAKSVVEKIPSAITFFIEPPSLDELKRRLTSRGTENAEDVARRLAQAERELASSSFYARRIVNDDVERALNEIVDILKDIK